MHLRPNQFGRRKHDRFEYSRVVSPSLASDQSADDRVAFGLAGVSVAISKKQDVPAYDDS